MPNQRTSPMSSGTKRRRAEAIRRGLRLFDQAAPGFGLSRSYCQTCRNRIAAAKRPTAKAKGLLRDLSQVHAQRTKAATSSSADLSAATEAHAELWRRHGCHWDPPPHDDLIRRLEVQLLQGGIDKERFDERCRSIIEKPPPLWMKARDQPETPLKTTVIPADVLHRALGGGVLKVGKNTTHLTAIPNCFSRRSRRQ